MTQPMDLIVIQSAIEQNFLGADIEGIGRRPYRIIRAAAAIHQQCVPFEVGRTVLDHIDPCHAHAPRGVAHDDLVQPRIVACRVRTRFRINEPAALRSSHAPGQSLIIINARVIQSFSTADRGNHRRHPQMLFRILQIDEIAIRATTNQIHVAIAVDVRHSTRKPLLESIRSTRPNLAGQFKISSILASE